MKKTVFMLIVVLLLIPVIGCASGISGEAVDVMKKLSSDSDTFIFIDITALQADSDLEDYFNDIGDSQDEFLESFGVRFSEVEYIALADEIIFLKGNFDLDEIRDELEDNNYDETKYNDVEVWEIGDIYADVDIASVALINSDLILFGSEKDVRDCIKIINGEDGSLSLYDNGDFKGVTDRLPDGIVIGCMKSGSLSDSLFDLDNMFNGLEALGLSGKKKDENTLNVTGVLQFEDKEAADNAMTDIEDMQEYLESSESDLGNIKISQDGEYIKVSADIDMDMDIDIDINDFLSGFTA